MSGFAGPGIAAFHDASTGGLRFASQKDILTIKGNAGGVTIIDCQRDRYPMPAEPYRLTVRETPKEAMEQIRGGLPAREVE